MWVYRCNNAKADKRQTILGETDCLSLNSIFKNEFNDKQSVINIVVNEHCSM